MSFVEKEIPRSGRASPYLDGRREWNERYGSHVAQARNWRLAAFAALGVAAVAVAGNVWQAGQARVQPFVVVVDQLGDQIAVGPVAASRRDDPRVATAQLRRWIMDVRAVTTDHETTTRNINEAYAMTDKNGPALMALNEWYAAHQPYARAANGTVSVTVTYVRWRAGQTWLVGWTEQERPLVGPTPAPRAWEAEILIASHPPDDAPGIKANPTGTYVHSFNWSPR